MAKTYRVRVEDYPEHLNPFFEDDNHNRIRFWTKTKKLVRSNSFSISGFNEGFKGLRNSIRKNVSRSRRTSVTNSPEPSPVMLRRNPPEEQSFKSADNDSEKLHNEHGFIVPRFDRRSYQYKSLTPTTRTKYTNGTTQNDEYFTLPTRPHRFRPEATSSPRKATSVCDHRTSQQPYALPGLTPSRKLSTASLNPFDVSPTTPNAPRRRISCNSINGGDLSLTRKKRRAPLPPNFKVNGEIIKHDDSGIQSLNTTQDSALLSTSLQITEDDLRKSVIEDTQPTIKIETPNTSPEIKIVISDPENDPTTLTITETTTEELFEVEIKENTRENSPDSVKELSEDPEGPVGNVEVIHEPEIEYDNNEINNNIEIDAQTLEEHYVTELSINTSEPEVTSNISEIPTEEKVTKYIDESGDYSIEHLRQEVNNLCADIELRTQEAKSVKEIIREINEKTAEEKRQSEIMRKSPVEETLPEPEVIPVITRQMSIDESRQILEQNGHLAKLEEFNDLEIKDEPKPIPRVKKEARAYTSPDFSKPNPIPKPKRSKLYSRIAKWVHK